MFSVLSPDLERRLLMMPVDVWWLLAGEASSRVAQAEAVELPYVSGPTLIAYME